MSGATAGVMTSTFESSELAPIFTPDILLPAQYTEQLRTRQTSPAHRLYQAILEDAIDCWLRCGPHVKGLALRRGLEAERWIWSDNEQDSYVSFAACCEVLGILPAYLRGKLAGLRDKRPMKIGLGRHLVAKNPFPLARSPKVPRKATAKMEAIAPTQLELGMTNAG